MLGTVSIGNFKSIVKCKFEPKRFNVFIGANGGGKSNLLEALAFGLAATGGTLENDSLVARGLRLSSFNDMCSRFLESSTIEIDLTSTEGSTANLQIKADTSGFNPRFEITSSSVEPRTLLIAALSRPLAEEEPITRNHLHSLEALLSDDSISVTMRREGKKKFSLNFKVEIGDDVIMDDEEVPLTLEERGELVKRAFTALKAAGQAADLIRFKDFTIYSPERSALLRPRKDSSTPVGNLGEGTLELIQFLAKHRPHVFEQLGRHLHTMDWFESIELNGNGDSHSEILLHDKYVSAAFSSRSANEGFLLLLFYFAIILSNETPQIFAIENVDQTLNPRLCRRLAEELSIALRTSGKQAFVTIHNPVFLDGLDFRQNDVGLFIVKRNFDGHTIVRAVPRPERFSKGTQRLSQAFIDGQIGGLPENF